MSDRPSREEALKAVETLISWAGDDPSREGLIETPDRVIRAYKEFFAGFMLSPILMSFMRFQSMIFNFYRIIKNYIKN